MVISRLNAAKCEEASGNREENITATPETPLVPPSNAIPVENPTKQKTVGTGLTRQMTRDLNDISNKKGKKITPHNSRQTKPQTNQKTRYAAPALRGNSRREGVLINRPPITYTNDSTIGCDGTPTVDWLRRQALASIKRPIPQPEAKKTYTQDKDYRVDHTRHTNPIIQFPCPTKKQTATTQMEQNEDAPKDQSSPHLTERDIYDSPKKTFSLDDFPVSLNSIKEYVTEKDGERCIPLHSTIVLKKRRRMLYLPLEFGEITMDGLVDSGAFINAMSRSDYNAMKMNSDNCVTKEYPQPPFKIECANAQLEQPIDTADIQFNIGTYTLTDTFVILSKTSFPIIGLNFMRNHQAVLDTANGTINFPHVEMTLAMTDEMKNCNSKPIQIIAEGSQTIPPQQTTTVSAILITTNANDVTGAVQPLPQFDETATIIVASALATAHNKRLSIRIANLTDFPHTIKNHTKLAELQILKPEDTKQIRPVDAAALKLLQDPDDTHMYVSELMKSSENEQNGENFWFPTPENPGNEEEHTPIQRRILKEIRELIKEEELEPTKYPESRKNFLDMFKWEGSQIEGNDRKQLEQTIVEYNDIFARHRLDIGINNNFIVKLTPKDERPIYTQSLPVPINLKEDLTVELALMQDTA